MPGAPRKRPFPADMLLNGHQLMLGQSSKGAALVATRPPTQDEVAPTDYGYSAQNPKYERVGSWRDMTSGFGLRTQKQFQDTRYYYSIAADLSVSGEYWLKGPLITTAVPADHPGEVVKFFELNGELFCLNGRFIQKVTLSGGVPTLFSTVATLHATVVATDVVVYSANGAAGTYAYIAMGDASPIQRFNGATATVHAEANLLYARRFCVVGGDLYRALAINQLSAISIDGDPFLWASWGADNQYYIGDKRYGITGMAVTATGSLLTFKENGIYTLDPESGQDIQYFPFLSFGTSSDNGRWPGQFLNSIHVTYGGSHYRIDPDMSIVADGPERFIENDSRVRGRITAFVGVGSLFGLAALWDPDTSQGHIMKYGAYVTGDKEHTELAQRIPAWHGSISQTFSSKITSMFVSTIGAPTGETMTYVGFADGSLCWFRNPCTPNPAACTNYRYTTAQAEVYLSHWHGGFFADPKTMRAITVTSLGLSPGGNSVTIQYKLDPATISWTSFTDTFQNSPWQKATFQGNSAGKLVAFRVLMNNITSTTSPMITGVGLHHSVHPELVQVYEMSILAVDGLLKRDASRLRLGAARIREIVEEAVSTDGSVPVVLPDETIQELTLVDYQQGVAWSERLKAWQAALTIKAMQFTASPSYGTYGRLEPYTYGELELRTYGGLEQL